MKLVTILINGHQLEVENTWSAKEIVRYDGRVMSERRSFWGGSHFFRVEEDDHLVNYEVTFNPTFLERIAIVIRRNGSVIFSSDRRIKPPKEVMLMTSSSGSGMVSAFGSNNRIQVECPYCGHRNRNDIEFCEKCRASI